MLEVAKKNGFHFDTVQMPVNVMDAHYRSFTKLVIPEAEKMGVAVLGMKSMGGGVILKSNTVTAAECLQFALSQNVASVITGIDSQQILDEAFQVASGFKPLREQQLAAILMKTETAAAKGEFELFKTSAHFDSTAQNPEWLGEETEQVRKLVKAS